MRERSKRHEVHAVLSAALTEYLIFLGEEQGFLEVHENFEYVKPVYEEVMGAISRELEKAGLPYPDVSAYLLTVA